jgi:hypothetical protein
VGVVSPAPPQHSRARAVVVASCGKNGNSFLPPIHERKVFVWYVFTTGEHLNLSLELFGISVRTAKGNPAETIPAYSTASSSSMPYICKINKSIPTLAD